MILSVCLGQFDVDVVVIRRTDICHVRVLGADLLLQFEIQAGHEHVDSVDDDIALDLGGSVRVGQVGGGSVAADLCRAGGDDVQGEVCRQLIRDIRRVLCPLVDDVAVPVDGDVAEVLAFFDHDRDALGVVRNGSQRRVDRLLDRVLGFLLVVLRLHLFQGGGLQAFPEDLVVGVGVRHLNLDRFRPGLPLLVDSRNLQLLRFGVRRFSGGRNKALLVVGILLDRVQIGRGDREFFIRGCNWHEAVYDEQYGRHPYPE